MSVYRLEQTPVLTSTARVQKALLVKPFTADAEFETDRLITLISATETQTLHYHRWASEPQELITAYIANRLQQSELFAHGVFMPPSTVISHYRLEGRVVECFARSGTAQPPNTATLTIHMTLQRTDVELTETVVLQKLYSETVPRTSDAASSIAPAISIAAARITDTFVRDITALVQ